MAGCEACRQTSSAMGCARHSQKTWGPGVAEMLAALHHRHRWVYDGQAGLGQLYHCDEHDPPEVRILTPTGPGLP